MRINSKYTLSFVVSIMMLSGCVPTPISITQTALPSISTATQLPGVTPPPTPEYPKLITPRVTPFPTISHAEANEDVARMLQTNGKCTFPCFWGIYPDQTRYEEIYSITDHLGGSRFETLQENGRIRISSDFGYGENIGIQVDLSAMIQDDIVRDLKVLLLNLNDTETTPEDWAAYNMDEILRTYGVPDEVELYLIGAYNSLSFYIQLKYENIDTFIIYSAGTSENKFETPTGVLFCPEEIGINQVQLHLGKTPFNTIPDGVPILEATGLNEQDFYKLFTRNSSACLTLNREAF